MQGAALRMQASIISARAPEPRLHPAQQRPAAPSRGAPRRAAPHQTVLPRHQRRVHTPPQAAAVRARQPPLGVCQPAQAAEHGGAAGGQRRAARLQVLALQARLLLELLQLLLPLRRLRGGEKALRPGLSKRALCSRTWLAGWLAHAAK